MIKKIMIAAMAMMLSVGAFAQNVNETIATVGTMSVPAVTISLDNDVKLVQNAMTTRMKDAGLKLQKIDGYNAALDQVFAEVSSSTINFYYKVEEQGRRNNRYTVLTICAIPNDLTQNQAMLVSSMRSFLEGFPAYMNRYIAAQNMAKEQDNLKKAEKAAASATSSVVAIDKKIASMQDKIVSKQKEIEKLKGKIADCEKEIKDLQKKIEQEGNKKSDAEKKVNEANENVKAVENEVERYRQLSE